ncbi:MAG: DUF6351 family protein [Gammaproteobacteria bacterium]|nr:DUF6351 family protein [Gammaproteobacteria bacterium]HJO11730.1 DUF6351 family protein [Gammaproteobacteria bacterium]
MILTVQKSTVQKIALSGLALMALASCTPQEQAGVISVPPMAPLVMESGISISTISTKPWLVTGGDVLVEVELADQPIGSQLRISLNEIDITGQFKSVAERRAQALLVGLDEGDSTITAQLGGGDQSETLDITNYPITGPIISGPQENPFYCQSSEFQLADGAFLDGPRDANCSVETRISYVYWSTEAEEFKPYSPVLGAAPADVGLISNAGAEVPFIVRVETGTVNRAIYEIAMLHDPAEGEIDPWTRSQGWNGKLVYTHGGGCRTGWYQQGNRTGGVLRKGLLEKGYALTSSTLNVFGQNCNDLLASETHIMVKERFIEHYGDPVYTIATGSSGGSYQSHQTADNYPGVFDGIIVASSFPDVTSATIFTLADSRLLNNYFTATNVESFTLEQQRAVAGYGSWGSIPNLSRGAARLDPLYGFDTPAEEQGGEVSIPALEVLRYDAATPEGVRTTVYDHTVNVYDYVEGSYTAQRPLDNVGIQYGLAALNEGAITTQQFIQLNRDIGGFDRDMNHVADRHQADVQASKRAIESGRILYGGAGLASTPIIDYRSYTDHRENGDIHMIVHQFSTRQRLVNANGHADNHVMNVGGLWGYTEDSPDLGDLFDGMDDWLMAIGTDTLTTDPVSKVVNAKPRYLNDNCWDNTGETRQKIVEEQTFAGNSPCNQLYPAYPTARHVAGTPLANDIVSCQLKDINPADYSVSFSNEQYAQLSEAFPTGVCDWSKGDASGASHQGTWISFGPSPVNQIQ